MSGSTTTTALNLNVESLESCAVDGDTVTDWMFINLSPLFVSYFSNSRSTSQIFLLRCLGLPSLCRNRIYLPCLVEMEAAVDVAVLVGDLVDAKVVSLCCP